jgi:hypothetical protein
MSEPKPDNNHDHQQSSLNAKDALTERKLANALSRKSGWFVVEDLSTTERVVFYIQST